MRLGLAALALLPLLASCAGAKPQQERRLVVSMSPPELKAGQMLQVTARPQPPADLAWVSGTVDVMGAPVIPFARASDGAWNFRIMVPVFASIRPGKYEAKAWGDTADGKRYEGNLIIDVK